jgi:hypothetical protein
MAIFAGDRVSISFSKLESPTSNVGDVRRAFREIVASDRLKQIRVQNTILPKG